VIKGKMEKTYYLLDRSKGNSTSIKHYIMDYLSATRGTLSLIRNKHLTLIPNNILGLIIYFFTGNKILEYKIVCKRWNKVIDSILCNPKPFVITKGYVSV